MKVGFIGLGSQGAPMARRIIDAGYPVVLWARRRDTLVPFAETAAKTASSIAELGACTEHVGICVRDDTGVSEVCDQLIPAMRPGGRIAILDLNRHHFEEARELYADLWLGFTELELEQHLRAAGFQKLETAIVHRETEPPHFETMLAVGEKAGGFQPLDRRRAHYLELNGEPNAQIPGLLIMMAHRTTRMDSGFSEGPLSSQR